MLQILYYILETNIFINKRGFGFSLLHQDNFVFSKKVYKTFSILAVKCY